MKIPKLTFDVKDKSHNLYNTWWNMIGRCYLPFAPGFENYGGRGVVVSEEWHNFKNFINDMGDRPKNKTLDRLDNDGNYCKDNCKWSNRSDQMLNRRSFRNSSTGMTGVVLIGSRYEARFHSDGIRYRIGTYPTSDLAAQARKSFIYKFKVNKAECVAELKVPKIWSTNKTGIRGISKHKDGGFIVRVTVNKKRIYIGYFKTFDEAMDAKREYHKE